VATDFLGSGRVFRLTTRVDGESAKDTRLEEISPEWGTRMGARSTAGELCRTGVGAAIGEDTDFRRCLDEGRGILISDVSEAVKDAGTSHPNQIASRL
jgi:hypothetical protein